MKRLLLSLLIAMSGLFATAQTFPYNNEWIDYSKTYYKIKKRAVSYKPPLEIQQEAFQRSDYTAGLQISYVLFSASEFLLTLLVTLTDCRKTKKLTL
jgi:hypothetical protein